MPLCCANNCRYECYNGMIQNNISTALSILAEVTQRLYRKNPEHPELIHLMQAHGILQNALEISVKGWAMHHGGTVEVELEVAP